MDDEHITWTKCPRCGDRAVVGWRVTRRWNGTVKEFPMSFGCLSGCTMTDSQVLYWFGGRH